MPKNQAEINYQIMKDAAANWGGLIDTLNAAGWEIEPETTGEELGRVMIALVNNANRDEEEAEDPLIASLAMAYEAFGLDEPPVDTAIHYGGAGHRWGLQHSGVRP